MKSTLENRVLLLLSKQPSFPWNAPGVAKELGISRVGAFKALRELGKEGIVRSHTLAGSAFYRLNLSDDFAFKRTELAFLTEARMHKRWEREFQDLYPSTLFVVLFGSILTREDTARDIDLLVVIEWRNMKRATEIFRKEGRALLNPFHFLPMTPEDFRKNLAKGLIAPLTQKCVILHGADWYLQELREQSGLVLQKSGALAP